MATSRIALAFNFLVTSSQNVLQPDFARGGIVRC
jgi:hypothetical protein